VIQVTQIYDPVGFAAAFLIRAKMEMQALWQAGVCWEEEPPLTVCSKWIELFKEMKELNKITFQRRLCCANASEPPMLCIFSDASQYAFGACAYICQRTNDNTYHVRLITAKSRVAPLKQLSIPRLELQAAVLASRLAKTVQQESKKNMSRRAEQKMEQWTRVFTASRRILATRNSKTCLRRKYGMTTG